MGFTPAQVDAMSVWEFHACVHGYSEAHGGKKSGGAEVSDEQIAMLGIEGL